MGRSMKKEKKCDIKHDGRLYREMRHLDITSMLSSGLISFNAEASPLDLDQWQPLLSYEDFGPYIADKLRLASNGYSYDSLFNHWYIKGEESNFGPFSLLEMLEFLQQDRIGLEKPGPTLIPQ